MKRNLLDDFSQASGLGSTNAMKSFSGIDHRGVGDLVSNARDLQGITLFTRPRLNLSYDNIALARILTPMLTEDPYTVPRVIRALLDPVGQKEEGTTTPLVDEHNPFIPILTNTLLSISGWPDFNIETYTAPEGMFKESWSMIDGISGNYGSYDLTANFRNMPGNPILSMFHWWGQYGLMVSEDTLAPRYESIVEHEIDYQTRIYRLILDPSKKYVQAIGAAIAAFPTAGPVGSILNHTVETPYANDTQQVSVPFKCSGMEFNDPILIKEFNDLVVLFNKEMGDEIPPGSKHPKRVLTHVKLTTHEELNLFNSDKCYPRIADDNELEWWVPRQRYFEVLNDLGNNQIVNP